MMFSKKLYNSRVKHLSEPVILIFIFITLTILTELMNFDLFISFIWPVVFGYFLNYFIYGFGIGNCIRQHLNTYTLYCLLFILLFYLLIINIIIHINIHIYIHYSYYTFIIDDFGSIICFYVYSIISLDLQYSY